MLGFFERLTNPFPDKEPTQPPQGLFAFCLHYSQGMVLPLILMSIATALLAALEVSLFGYMGAISRLVGNQESGYFLAGRAGYLDHYGHSDVAGVAWFGIFSLSPDPPNYIG